jgi:GAF domain-containing protein
LVKLIADIFRSEIVVIYKLGDPPLGNDPNRPLQRNLIVSHSIIAEMIGLSVPASSTFRSAVVDTQTSKVSVDLINQEDFRHYEGHGIKVKNNLCSPAIFDGHSIGLIEISNGNFSSDDIRLFEFLCSIAAPKIKELIAFPLNSSALTKPVYTRVEVEMLIQSTIEQAYSSLDADRISIFAYDDDSQKLHCLISKDIAGYSVPVDSGLIGSSFTSLSVINTKDVKADQRHYNILDQKVGYQTRNALSAPILAPTGKPIGVLQALNKRSGDAFTSMDEEEIRNFCSRSAVLLQQMLEADEKKLLRDANRNVANFVDKLFKCRGMEVI